MAATRILVVDDDQDTCASLSDILLDLGYTVDTANDGLAALELSHRNLYRLALLDYMMPGMNGLELCRHMRASWPTLQVALVTGWASISTTTSETESGIRRVIPKPVDFGELIRFVEEVVCDDVED
jgi:DNA-binding response OmpR family regulator